MGPSAGESDENECLRRDEVENSHCGEQDRGLIRGELGWQCSTTRGSVEI